jgi:hypothetical protein
MNSTYLPAMVLATCLWIGLAALVAVGGPAPRTGEFWMSASAAKAQPRAVRAAAPSKLARAE